MEWSLLKEADAALEGVGGFLQLLAKGGGGDGGVTVLLSVGGLGLPRRSVRQSRDGGFTWELLLEEAPWPARCGHAIAVLPSNRVVLIGGVDTSDKKLNDVWVSDDEGLSWQQVEGIPFKARSGAALLSTRAACLLLLGGASSSEEVLNDVWKSVDGGTTWTQVQDAAPWPGRHLASSCVLPPSGPTLKSRVVLLGGSAAGSRRLDDVWQSEDEGSSWDLLVDGAPWAARHSAALIANNQELLLLGGSSASGAQCDVWSSTDGGPSWVRVLQSSPWQGRAGHGTFRIQTGAAAAAAAASSSSSSSSAQASSSSSSFLIVAGQDCDKGGFFSDIWSGLKVQQGMASSMAAVANSMPSIGFVPPPPPPPPPPPGKASSPLRVTGSGSGSGSGSAAGSAPPPPKRPPPPNRAGPARAEIPHLQGGPQATADVSGADPTLRSSPRPSTMPRYEDMAAADIRKAILDLQKGLADITRKLDTVGMENHLLREENSQLKEAIDDKIEGAR